MTPCCQVTTTFPSQELAARVGAQLVQERLAACAQVQGPIASVYRWRGDVEQANEWYCHLKSTVAILPELRARLRALHPYEVPEIIAVPIVEGDPAYLAWIADSVRHLT